ncbi:Clavaminate synthase-like protein [Trichoderma citrinoviride]|uniref:Clavaminate synthase-like protein n=1 Tax=Trichoderma citrinoviride TaxID=58853 RepID=A0A2T4BJB7_9HYPO|nr:Clavaminate synthase-like protein [Trichoderma citrinoviride]PTB69349.1 Clavaminate synthase-like protein [Trichoderma citrinoviride]
MFSLARTAQARAAGSSRAKAHAAAAPHVIRTAHTQTRLASSSSPSSSSLSDKKLTQKQQQPQNESPNSSSIRAPVTVAWTDKFLYVEDPAKGDGRRTLKPATLRDSCSCPRCRDPSSGQKTFSSVEVPVDIGLEDVKPTKKGLEVTFLRDIPRFTTEQDEHANEKKHMMLLPWESVDMALKRKTMEDITLPRQRSIFRRTGVAYWDRQVIANRIRHIDYAAFMQEDADNPAFWDVVIDLCRLGIVFLKNVPRDESSVENITSRIANIKETFYGRTFDVRAKPDAENVAYTNGFLGLHQDLLYLDPPPMIQVLHCMDASRAGGESLFSDGERVGRLLWPYVARHRVAPLAEHHVPYQYSKHGFHYFSSRRVLEGNAAGFTNVFWSPPFQGRYMAPVKDIRGWIRPARVFSELINHPDAVYEHKMEPGECVLFDNLRVLHGRNAFDKTSSNGGGGERWLRGAYIAAEDFLSRAAHIPKGLAEKYRGEVPWTPGLAQQALRRSVWHEDVVRRLKELDPGIEA